MAHKNTKDDLNRSEKQCNELETKLDSAEFAISILKFESKNSTADREILGNALDELKGNNFKLSQALIKKLAPATKAMETLPEAQLIKKLQCASNGSSNIKKIKPPDPDSKT